MVPQLEKIYEETKLAKKNLRKEQKEKAKLEPQEGFFPTEHKRPNIGMIMSIVGVPEHFSLGCTRLKLVRRP